MTDFCKRFLVLTVGALAFAGASYGQGNITSCSVLGQGLGVVPGALNLRGEGTTELVGDLQFQCVNSGATTSTGTITAFLSAPVTSKLLTTATAGSPVTEATLFLGGTVYPGLIAGNQVSFSNVTFPAGSFTSRISDVRVNANAIPLSATLTTVTEQILASANGTSASTSPPSTVGFVFKSLNGPGFLANPNGGFSPTISPYTTCVGNPLPLTGNLNANATPPGPWPPTNYSFVISASETFGGAFKMGTGAPPFGEGGNTTGAGGAGVASFGTRIQLVFSNVSTGMTVYVPTSITNGFLTLQLVPSATAAEPSTFPAVQASTTTGAPTAGSITPPGQPTETYSASFAYTPSSGSLTVVYEVTGTNPAAIEGAFIPVWVVFSNTQFQTAQGPITVLESYAPTAAAAAATTIPNFAPVTTGALNATTVNTCATNLLFPYMTNGLGFDTGIVLANTSTDPFGTTPQPGSCTLNFYGTGAPTAAVAAPNPTGGATPYTQPGGTTNAFLLSGVAPGFTGYMIAQCNYQYGYGYAFIEYNLGQNSGIAEGYIAVDLTRTGPVAPAAVIGQ